ncbi:hypothetical protein HMI56_006769 [Coelomomyces lativittatus]|nr:hypothetical protein HMI56_006769 [Coelomomyces lativittatus]
MNMTMHSTPEDSQMMNETWHTQFQASLLHLQTLLNQCAPMNDKDTDPAFHVEVETLEKQLQHHLKEARRCLMYSKPEISIQKKVERQKKLIQDMQPVLQQWKLKLNEFIASSSSEVTSLKIREEKEVEELNEIDEVVGKRVGITDENETI